MIKMTAYVSFIIFFASMVLGCASTHKTTTETTVFYPDGAVGNIGNRGNVRTATSDNQDNRGVVETSETTTTSTGTKAENPGILSSTFHAIGYVIALPFIIVGGLIKMIFGG